MRKFTSLTGVAAPLPQINIDTDKIIPKQYLKTIERTGLGKGLFHELRYDKADRDVPDFVLNKAAYRQAKILITGENFGCGSSREHAPWALLDFGITCVIAESFGDIFYNNALKNGVLPVRLDRATVALLMEEAGNGANATFTIDLPSQTITRPSGETVHFEIDPFRKHCLIEGLDDIGLTLAHEGAIGRYEAERATDAPWLEPSAA